MRSPVSTYTGTWPLVRLMLRRDRVRLPVWLLAILGVVYSSAEAVQGMYGTPEKLDVYAQTMANSAAVIVMSGPPTALHTLGGVTVYEINTTALVAVALMAIFLVVRHTRTEEEAGRTELLRSTVVGRHAPTTAALIVASLACLVVGAGIGAMLLGSGLETSGSLLYAASVAALGIAFATVAACAAQITAGARSALGISGAVIAATFLLRGIGDVRDGTLSLFTPFGWAQAARPFGDQRWWWLLALPAFGAAMLALSGWLASHRDFGAGIVQARPGPEHASPRLGSATGLAARLQRGSIIGWSVGLFTGGVAIGSVGREVTAMVEGNPSLAELFAESGTTIVDSYFSLTMTIMALIAAGFTVSSVLRLRSEEDSGRAEPLLATTLTRGRWAFGSLLVTVMGTTVVVGAAGLGTGLAHSLTTSDFSQLPPLLGASLAYVPAALLLGGLAAVLHGWLPRWSPVAWAAVAFCFVVSYLGVLLDIPQAIQEISPFTHVPAMPADPMTWAPLLVLGAIAVAAAVVGGVGLRRRDIA